MKPLKVFLDYLAAYWYVILGIVVAAYLSTELRLYVAVLLGDAVNAAVGGGRASLLNFALMIIGVTAVSAAFQFSVSYGGQWIAQKIAYDLRRDLFSSVISKNFRFYDSVSSGDLTSRSTMDVEAIRRFLGIGLPQLLTTSFLLVLAVYTLFTINFKFVLIFLGTVPILLMLTIILAVKQEPLWDKIRLKYGAMTSWLQQNILGYKVVRAYNAEEEQSRVFRSLTQDYLENYVGVSRIRSIINPLLSLVVSLAIASLLVYGNFGYTSGGLTIGSIESAVYVYTLMLPSIRFFGQLVVLYENAMAGMRRLIGVMHTKNDVNENNAGISADNIMGEVVFEDVWLSQRGTWVLRGVNLRVAPGEAVGIVGESGSGKSSLVQLVPRFYDPDKGRVLIDGVDVKEYNTKSLRKRIGYVSQDIVLFSGTIYDNIALGARNPKPEDVREAVRVARLDEFIANLPDGYSTIVGERGITLSGGQRQRVAIARAILSKPRILILDDPTSNLDAETEMAIKDALKYVFKGCTVLLVTHRLSMLNYANRVVVIKDGAVVEDGDLNTLLKANGELSRLFSTKQQVAG
ncbi:MAG: ABC transporter ATP-binding protein [Thermoprotei archaeon]